MAKKPAAPAWDGTCSLLEFATHYGVAPSYITELKGLGRLVLTADGARVVALASAKLIAETADPSRDGDGETSHAQRRAKAIADKAEYDAEEARMQLAKSKAELWLRTEIRAALEIIKRTLDSALEGLPAIHAAEVAALTDEAQVRVKLEEATGLVRGEIVRRLDGIAKTGADPA